MQTRSIIRTAIAAVAFASLTALPALAQVKVAVFDAQMIYADSNAAKRAGQQLKSKQDAANQQIQALEKPLAAKQQQLAQQQTLLAADKRKAAEDEFRKEYLAFRQQAAKISQDFENAQFTARKQLADAMRASVAEIAKEKGYDLVLPKAVAIYAGPAVPDVSADVLARVNAKLK